MTLPQVSHSGRRFYYKMKLINNTLVKKILIKLSPKVILTFGDNL